MVTSLRKTLLIAGTSHVDNQQQHKLFNDYRKDELVKLFGTEQSTIYAIDIGKAELLIFYKDDDIV